MTDPKLLKDPYLHDRINSHWYCGVCKQTADYSYLIIHKVDCEYKIRRDLEEREKNKIAEKVD